MPRLPRSERPSSRRLEGDCEGGALTLYAVILVVVLCLVVGLVVDGGAMVHAYQRANAVCREAARLAGQELSFDQSHAVVIGWGEAEQVGQAALAQQGCDQGTVSLAGTTVSVTCHYSYAGTFLPIDYHVTGRGSAQAGVIG